MPETFTFRQPSLAGGYLSPQLLGRTDTEKYQAGLAQVRNMFGNRTSGQQNRPGSLWCGACRSNTPGQTKLLPFVLSNQQSYELEIAPGAIRPWKNGAPLSLAALASTFTIPTYTGATYAPPGQIVSTLAAGYWYTLDEQFALGCTLTLSATGGWAAGAQVTLTASQAIWNAAMCQTGAVVTVYVPGQNTVAITLTQYVSGTVVRGTVDSAVPTAVQNTAWVRWKCRYQIYGLVNYLGDAAGPNQPGPTTQVYLFIHAANYAAGQPLTIYGANLNFSIATQLTNGIPVWSDDLVALGAVISIPSPLGLIQATITGINQYQAGVQAQSATCIANLPIPMALQDTVLANWSIPLNACFATFSPLGPTLDPVATFPPGSPSLAISTATDFSQGQVLTVTATGGNVFTNTQILLGTALVIHDGLGNTFTLTPVAYSSPTSATFQCSQPIPAGLQNIATTYWSYAVVAPAAGPWWYQLVNGVVEIPTQMLAAAIPAIRSAQHNDIVRFTAQAFATVELNHYSDARWLFQNWLPAPSIRAPTGLYLVASKAVVHGGTQHTFQYTITAVAADGEESLASNPVTCVSATPSDGQGGNNSPNVLTWSPVPGAVSYKIYLQNGYFGPAVTASGFPGLVGSADATGFVDSGFVPNEADQPPVALPLLQSVNDYPAVCGFFGQRFLLGNTANQPQTFWSTRVQQFYNLCTSTPLVDDDAFFYVLSGNEVQFIEAFVDLGKLIIHTSNAEYVCQGNLLTGSLTASQINAVIQGGHGAASLQPVTIGNTDIFIQSLGNLVRDLRYDIYKAQYGGKDVTIFTPDLFINRTVVQMAWQQVKDSIVWMVMSDGSMLSLTYIQEENVWEWGTHDTGNGADAYLGVIVVPEGGHDVVYVLVNRNGTVSLERFAQRDIVDTAWLTDALFCDGGQVFDGRNAAATTITLTSVTGGWTPGDTLKLTASAPTFSAADVAGANPQGVANVYLLRQVSALGYDTTRLYFVSAVFIDSTHLEVVTNANVPAWAQGTALTTWGKAVHAFSGLAQLNGRAIAILGDGNVLASPLNPQTPNPFPTVVVAGGAFVIPGAAPGADPLRYNAMVVCAGLPIVAQLTSLPLENQKGSSILGRQAKVDEIIATFYQSRGGFYGQLAPSGDSQILKPWKQRNLEALGSPTALFSGSVRVNALAGNWGRKGMGTGQVVMQQPDPLPLGISGFTTVAEIGD